MNKNQVRFNISHKAETEQRDVHYMHSLQSISWAIYKDKSNFPRCLAVAREFPIACLCGYKRIPRSVFTRVGKGAWFPPARRQIVHKNSLPFIEKGLSIAWLAKQRLVIGVVFASYSKVWSEEKLELWNFMQNVEVTIYHFTLGRTGTYFFWRGCLNMSQNLKNTWDLRFLTFEAACYIKF